MSMGRSSAVFQPLGIGRNRMVFRRGAWVVKVPLNEEGIYDNDHERQVWLRNRERGYIKYAACRLIGTMLVMRYVKPIRRYSEFPEWADYVDCQQVGRAPDGRVLAYDYGWF